MPTWKFEGLDEYIKQIEQVNYNSEKYLKKALHEGAGLMADGMKQAIESLPTQDGNVEGIRTGIRSVQKQGLVQSFGISKMREEGMNEFNVKLGFDGRNALKSKKYPQGQSNAMIARQVESGTSWMRKNAFVSRTQRAYKAKVEERMRIVLDEEIKKLVK